MKKIILTAIVTASVALFCQHSEAAGITGDLAFAGVASFNTSSLATATQVNSWAATTQVGTGSFAGIPFGTSVTLATPYIFSPSTPTLGLWSVAGFTFDLATSVIVTQNSGTLDITGTGILSGNGFDPTPGMWAFTSQKAGGGTATSFSFSADTTSVPDGGSAVALLGIALAGIEAGRRLIRSRKA